jgi:hypothetical protein
MIVSPHISATNNIYRSIKEAMVLANEAQVSYSYKQMSGNQYFSQLDAILLATTTEVMQSVFVIRTEPSMN